MTQLFVYRNGNSVDNVSTTATIKPVAHTAGTHTRIAMAGTIRLRLSLGDVTSENDVQVGQVNLVNEKLNEGRQRANEWAGVCVCMSSV